MNDADILDIPRPYAFIKSKTEETGFSMPSDLYLGTLLKTLVTSKPAGRFLELGTGTGLSLSWIIAGMDEHSQVISVDSNSALLSVAAQALGKDPRVDIVCEDGARWLEQYQGAPFDLIFADTWPGKYTAIEKALNLLAVGGFYIIDDMRPQPSWPAGHAEKATSLVTWLEACSDLHLTKMNWSTGLILAVKKQTHEH